jgi:hypothetical protein
LPQMIELLNFARGFARAHRLPLLLARIQGDQARSHHGFFGGYHRVLLAAIATTDPEQPAWYALDGRLRLS